MIYLFFCFSKPFAKELNDINLEINNIKFKFSTFIETIDNSVEKRKINITNNHTNLKEIFNKDGNDFLFAKVHSKQNKMFSLNFMWNIKKGKGRVETRKIQNSFFPTNFSWGYTNRKKKD